MDADSTYSFSAERTLDPPHVRTLAIVMAALCLGLLNDALLRATPWGLNLFLWIGALVVTTWTLERAVPAPAAQAAGATTGMQPIGWALAALPFAAGIVWRDSPVLFGLDLLSILVCLALSCWKRQGRPVILGTLTSYFLAGLSFVGEILSGFLTFVFRNVRWKQMPSGGWLSHAGSILAGLFLAVPFLILFGALFSAADAAFEKLVVQFFSFDQLVLHALAIGLGGWFAGGFLHGTLVRERASAPPVAFGWRPRLGPVEVGIVLGCLNLLFLGFIVVQFRYFFGGESQLEITPGLLRSEYARRGFFELVTVASLLLPLLLGADWLLGTAARKTTFRRLAALLVLMLFVIMISAVQRMWIYQREFGLTELRLYTSTFMAWLAVVFVWFCLTVLTGRRERFAFGALLAGWMGIAVLHLINPDGLIVRVNAARAAAGHSFDSNYVRVLSADDSAALVEVLPQLPENEQKLVRDHLDKHVSDHTDDWRSWNLSRAQARRLAKDLKDG